jgi:6-phosphogluconate dehydrogenase
MEAAVIARSLSAYKEERLAASTMLAGVESGFLPKMPDDASIYGGSMK